MRQGFDDATELGEQVGTEAEVDATDDGMERSTKNDVSILTYVYTGLLLERGIAKTS